MSESDDSTRNIGADKAYTKDMAEKLAEVIDKLKGINEVQTAWLKERWLDQIVWMEDRAYRHKNRYYRWRVFAIVGGILIPLLITISQAANLEWLAWVAAGLGAAVAIAASIEEFFHDGERWRNYRSSVELLKSEGWQYVNLGGPYRHFEDHSAAFTKFSERVEGIIQLDVQTYISDIVGEREVEGKRAASGQAEIASSIPPGGTS